MKKSFLLALAVAVAAGQLWAAPVTPAKARQVATAWLTAATGGNAQTLVDVTPPSLRSEMYIFSGESCFAIVAADDGATPILAYSTDDPFATETMPPQLEAWLEGYSLGIAELRTDRQLLALSEQREAAAWKLWTRPQSAKGSPAKADTAVVKPLLTARWDQGARYNNYCPYDSAQNKRCVTGCVATGMGQIMQYWQWPDTGYGSHSYNDTTRGQHGVLSANFGETVYDWSLMPDALTAASSEEQIDAVATLMAHLGVAVEMMYSPSASGSWGNNWSGYVMHSAESAFIKYFKYNTALHDVYRLDFSTEEWGALLRNELDHGRPCPYEGASNSGAHFFVCDGYDSGGKFHLNWGWAGSGNGYYAIDAFNVQTNGNYMTYNSGQRAMIGLEPNLHFGEETVVETAADNDAHGTVTSGGTLNFGDTLSLVATAKDEDYRFAGWSDGCSYNPRPFIAMGCDTTVHLTARFVPIAADTVSYMSSQHTLVNYNGGLTDYYWGIKLPAAALSAGKYLTAVKIKLGEKGHYTLTVFTGDQAPTTEVCTVTLNATPGMAKKWREMVLPESLKLEGVKNVWIRFHTDDCEKAAYYSYSGGNPNSALWGVNLQSMPDFAYSWMIKAVVSNTAAIETPTEAEAAFALYPNPATDRVTVGTEGLEGSATLQVMRVDGSVAMSRTVACGGNTEIDLGGLTPGTYFVRLTDGTHTTVRKLVVGK